MLASGGWFSFEALRGGQVELGSAMRGSWSASWPQQPLQFGCLLLVWLALALLGLTFVVAGIAELDAFYAPLLSALLLVPVAGYNSWYRIGGPAPVYLEQASDALQSGNQQALTDLSARIPTAALCRLIEKASRLQKSLRKEHHAPLASGYRQAADPNEPVRQRFREELQQEADKQLRRLALGWFPGLIALVPPPMLLIASVHSELDSSALPLALLALVVFLWVSRSAWRARQLLRDAPPILAEAAMVGMIRAQSRET